MTYTAPPPPPSFLPPAPPRRKSRGGGIMLLLAGALALGAAWLPLVSANGQSLSLYDFYNNSDKFAAMNPSFVDDPRTWFFALVGGGAIAALFGLIGLAGGTGANVTAGIFGLLAAIAIAFPPVYMLSGADILGNGADLLKLLGAGYYMAAAAGLIALIGMLFAFIGAAKK